MRTTTYIYGHFTISFLRCIKLTPINTALRTLLLGPASSAGKTSNRGHYELSSGDRHRSWRTRGRRNTANTTGVSHNKENSSEEALDRNLDPSTASVERDSVNDKNNAIQVSTTFQVHYEMDQELGRHSATHM